MKKSDVLERFRLDGNVVLVTGGGGLLGRGYCRAIVEAGGIPIAADLDEKSAHSSATLAGGDALGLRLDVTSRVSVESCFGEIERKFGRLDALVNNAAFNCPAQSPSPNFVSFEDFPIGVWNESLAVDLTGLLLCTQNAGKVFLNQRSGVVVNISSTYGTVAPDQRIYETLKDPLNPDARFTKPIGYSTTKAAIQNITRYLAVLWADSGIRVNTLTLGGVFDEQDNGFVERYEARTPMGRMARLGEYEAALVFLLSDAASYMTGGNMTIDGGWTAW